MGTRAIMARVAWLSLQHISDMSGCSAAVTVVAQTNDVGSALYFDRTPMMQF